MNPETKNILANMETYLATGVIHDDLVPYYDQNGKWFGAPIIWFHTRRLSHLDRIKSSYLPVSRRTCRDRSGTILCTTFIWSSNKSVRLNYSRINGSLLVESNATIHAACLREVRGNLMSTTNRRVDLPNLRSVDGNFVFVQTFELHVPRLHHVGGRAKMLGSLPPRLTTVGRSLGLYWAFEAESDHLKSVGDYFALTKAEVVNFPQLETIGGSFLTTLKTHVIHVHTLRYVGGDFLADATHDLRAPALRIVGGNLDTTSAKEFYHPRIKVSGTWTTYPGDIEDWHRRDAARRALKSRDILL